MSRLEYPSEGLYPTTKNSLSIAKTQLNAALGGTVFNIPPGFSGAGYLNGLRSKITEFSDRANAIDERVQEIDRNFQVLTDELRTRAHQFEPPILEERVRLI